MHEHELTKHALVKGQVLLVCTSCRTVGDRKDTGVWLSEVAVPYYIFYDNGYDVTMCSVNGGEIPVDPAGLSEQEKERHSELMRFLADDAAMLQLRQSVPLSSVSEPAAYDCIFLAGGHGAMGDMPGNAELKRVVEEASGKGSMPFQLEARLKELGAKVRAEDVDAENAVRDKNLVTGQNHYSAARVATLVLEALSVHPSGPAAPIVGQAAGAVAEA